MRIVVAEDDPVSLRVIQLAVERLGHTCTTARDGEAAWDLFRQSPPDVILSDWTMPIVDGLELCRRVRAAGESAYTYFIFMTGRDDKQSFLQGMRAGADDYLTKPVDLDELEARLLAATRVTSLHRRLVEVACTDALTGVGNRLRLRDDLAALRGRVDRYGHRYAAALCDIDHFKAFNDRHGHLGGDEALAQVARVITSEVRSGDAVYRYGGEEFLIILPEQSADGGRIAMDRVRAAVERLGIVNEGVSPPRPVTVSVGIAEMQPGDAASWEAWLARADEALYRAKALGKNRICVWGTET